MDRSIYQLVALLLTLPWGQEDLDILHRFMDDVKSQNLDSKISRQELNYLWNFTQLDAFPGNNSNHVRHDFFKIGDKQSTITKSIISTDSRQIRFYLYNDPTNPHHGKELRKANPDTVRFAGIRSKAPLKILVHGFQQNYESVFPQRMKDEYLKTGENYNILIVDWGPLARSTGPLASIFYPFAVENVPRVGEKLADFITFLRTQSFISDVSLVHIIGFSLGAHVAGIAGNLISKRSVKKIGRITGLDPAKPTYTTTQPFSRRLDPSDATFVDVVHTSVKLGYPGQLGHIDFYINGGVTQPNCDPNPGAVKSVQKVYSLAHLFEASCSHSRAYLYFTKSISSEEIACRCASWEDFRQSCKELCKDEAVFGEYVSQKSRGKFFLDMTV